MTVIEENYFVLKKRRSGQENRKKDNKTQFRLNIAFHNCRAKISPTKN